MLECIRNRKSDVSCRKSRANAVATRDDRTCVCWLVNIEQFSSCRSLNEAQVSEVSLLITIFVDHYQGFFILKQLDRP